MNRVDLLRLYAEIDLASCPYLPIQAQPDFNKYTVTLTGKARAPELRAQARCVTDASLLHRLSKSDRTQVV